MTAWAAALTTNPLTGHVYSAADLITVLAAFGVLISSVVTGIVTVIGTLRNGQKTDKLSVAVIGDEKTPGLINQVAEVHTVVNSNLAALKAELSSATLQIASLGGTISDLKSERDKLAARVAEPAPAASMEVKEMNVEELNVPPKKG